MPRSLPWLFFMLLVSSCGEDARSRPEDETIVFRNSAGQALTKRDLLRVDGTMNWTVTGGGKIPSEAQQLHEQGRRSGERGDYTNALAAFHQASQLAPDWQYPIYDIAYTYLLIGRDSEALENYERVERMDPAGFFTTKTALWALRAEKSGKYPRGTYLSFLAIEWVTDDAKKDSAAGAILDRCPDYPPAWKEIALRTEDPKRKAEAIDRGLAASPDGETFGILTINKALFLRNQGEQKKAIAMLGELALSTNSTRASAALAKATLASIIAESK